MNEVSEARQRLEGLLNPWFDVPFADNNLTAKNLTDDLARLSLLQRSPDTSGHAALSQVLAARLDALAQGRVAMVVTGESVLWAKHEGQVVESTESRYRDVFDLRPSSASYPSKSVRHRMEGLETLAARVDDYVGKFHLADDHGQAYRFAEMELALMALGPRRDAASEAPTAKEG